MLRGKQFAALVFLSLTLGFTYSLWLWHLDWAFVDAACRGDIPAVRSYLAQGVSPDARGLQGRSALEYAALRNDLALVRLLLRAGADPGGAIYEAAGSGNCKVVAILLNAGAPMWPYLGELSLRVAAGSSDIASATVLLHHSVDINCKERWSGDHDFTPVLVAARQGSWAMFKFLVDRGADLTARTTYGDTALTLAMRSRNPDKERICRYLIGRMRVADGQRNQRILSDIAALQDRRELSGSRRALRVPGGE